MSTDKYAVALAQVAPRLGALEANRELFEARVSQARGLGADLVIFPELSLTGYFLKDQVPNVALRLESSTMKWLRNLSRRISIVVGLVEESDEFLFYNTAVYLEGGEIRHLHRKCYLPTYGLFDEQRYFAAGDRLGAFDSRFGRMSLLICEDMWHPSTVYLAAADRALSVICISSSPIWGLGLDKLPDNARHWEQLTRFHASTWGVYVAYCNRVGFEDGVGFWGGSELIDALGEPVCKAPYYDEAMVVGEVKPSVIKRKRMSSTMVRDENLDLTLNELQRIRTGAGRQRITAAARTRQTISKRSERR